MLPLKGFLLLCKGSSNKAATAWAILNPNSRAFVCKLILSYCFYDVIKVEGMNCNDDWKFFKGPSAKCVDLFHIHTYLCIQIWKIIISWWLWNHVFLKDFKKFTTVSLCNSNGDPQVRVIISITWYKDEPAWTHALEGPHWNLKLCCQISYIWLKAKYCLFMSKYHWKLDNNQVDH